MIKKYIKKPIEIEALQWTGDNYIEMDSFITMHHETYPSKAKLFIHTLEGVMECSIDDYIIKGIFGEFYPCKPEIFEATYDLKEE